MAEKSCCVCGKSPLSKDELALYKKLMDKNAVNVCCLTCLADFLAVSEEDLLVKIEEFKEAGCTLFM